MRPFFFVELLIFFLTLPLLAQVLPLKRGEDCTKLGANLSPLQGDEKNDSFSEGLETIYRLTNLQIDGFIRFNSLTLQQITKSANPQKRTWHAASLQYNY